MAETFTMLDPFSAIVLASAIIQFVDFGSKLKASGHETFGSTHDFLEENIDLEFLTQGLYEFQDQVATPLRTLARSNEALELLAK